MTIPGRAPWTTPVSQDPEVSVFPLASNALRSVSAPAGTGNVQAQLRRPRAAFGVAFFQHDPHSSCFLHTRLTLSPSRLIAPSCGASRGSTGTSDTWHPRGKVPGRVGRPERVTR